MATQIETYNERVRFQLALDELFPRGTVVHVGSGSPGRTSFRGLQEHPTARPFVISALEQAGEWFYELVIDQKTMQDWRSIEATGFATNADKPARFWVDELQESDEFAHLLESQGFQFSQSGDRLQPVFWLRYQKDPKTPVYQRTAEERERLTEHWLPEVFPQGLEMQKLVVV